MALKPLTGSTFPAMGCRALEDPRILDANGANRSEGDLGFVSILFMDSTKS
jgi:hypothetical protein